jgi:hypothetical protein
MRTRNPPRAPDIDVLAQHYLQMGLRKHPDIGQHVADVADVAGMPLLKLMKLAQEMGLDANAVIEKTEQEESELSRYSIRYPGFRGELEFDLTISFLGNAVTRKAKVVFEHTPEWPYFDLNKRAEFKGWHGTCYHVEVAAVPESDHEDGTTTFGTPYWVHLEDIAQSDVLPHSTWDALLDAIDEKCKAEDAERRRMAAARAASPSKASRRRH